MPCDFALGTNSLVDIESPPAALARDGGITSYSLPVSGRRRLFTKDYADSHGPLDNLIRTFHIPLPMANYAGQGVGLIEDILPAATIVERIASGAELILKTRLRDIVH